MALRHILCFREISYLNRSSLNILERHVNFNNLVRQTKFTRNFKNRRSNENVSQSTTPVKQSPFGNFTVESGPIPSSNIWKSLVFTVAFGAGSFAGCIIWEYETMRAKAIKALKKTVGYNWFKNRMQSNNRENQSLFRDVENWWNKLSHGEKMFIPICAANIAVFGLWRVPRFQPQLVKYFCSNPAGKAVCWPMFLSSFSHYSLYHIFANMYVLHSFSHAAVATLGREQFLGLYLTAGVVSSFASYCVKAVMQQPGLSLGASGAIMTVLAYVCAQYPDTKLSILFLPMFTFSAGSALMVIMGVDLAGVVLGWRFFDHAAHLGGATLGLLWCYYGQYLWPKREYLVGYWHQLRGPPTSQK